MMFHIILTIRSKFWKEFKSINAFKFFSRSYLNKVCTDFSFLNFEITCCGIEVKIINNKAVVINDPLGQAKELNQLMHINLSAEPISGVINDPLGQPIVREDIKLRVYHIMDIRDFTCLPGWQNVCRVSMSVALTWKGSDFSANSMTSWSTWSASENASKNIKPNHQKSMATLMHLVLVKIPGWKKWKRWKNSNQAVKLKNFGFKCYYIYRIARFVINRDAKLKYIS